MKDANRKPRYLAFGYHVIAPKGKVRKIDVLRELLNVVQSNGEHLFKLPNRPDVKVNWRWKNGPNLKWLEENVNRVASESSTRGAFNLLAENRIRKDIFRLGVNPPKRKPIRNATNSEIEQLEDIESEHSIGRTTRRK